MENPISTEEAAAAGGEASAIPQQHKSAFLEFLQQLATFSGDLRYPWNQRLIKCVMDDSAMTAPSFLLNGISLLEYSAHWGDYPALLAAIPNAPGPNERMLAVVRWFLSTFYGSFHERCANGSEKKPYNPILGEQFFCEMEPDTANGDKWPKTSVIVEQVSHHPPITAFHLTNANQDIAVTGSCGRKTKFKSMTVKVEQAGSLSLTLPKLNETFTFTYPELILRGLISGNVFIELSGLSKITSSSGVVATIEYVPKPWFYGEYHTIKGAIFHQDKESSPFYTLSGKWTETMYYKSAQSSTQELLHDAKASRPGKSIKPVSEQGDLESRKVWQKVTEALLATNYALASKEKTDIEERQRAYRRDREATGGVWSPKFFEFVPVPQIAGSRSGSNLSVSKSDLKKSSSQLSMEFDNGFWRFLQGSTK